MKIMELQRNRRATISISFWNNFVRIQHTQIIPLVVNGITYMVFSYFSYTAIFGGFLRMFNSMQPLTCISRSDLKWMALFSGYVFLENHNWMNRYYFNDEVHIHPSAFLHPMGVEGAFLLIWTRKQYLRANSHFNFDNNGCRVFSFDFVDTLKCQIIPLQRKQFKSQILDCLVF